MSKDGFNNYNNLNFADVGRFPEIDGPEVNFDDFIQWPEGDDLEQDEPGDDESEDDGPDVDSDDFIQWPENHEPGNLEPRDHGPRNYESEVNFDIFIQFGDDVPEYYGPQDQRPEGNGPDVNLDNLIQWLEHHEPGNDEHGGHGPDINMVNLIQRPYTNETSQNSGNGANRENRDGISHTDGTFSARSNIRRKPPCSRCVGRIARLYTDAC